MCTVSDATIKLMKSLLIILLFILDGIISCVLAAPVGGLDFPNSVSFSSVHKELAGLLHGDPTKVTPSLDLCDSSSDDKKGSRTLDKNFYFGNGSCNVVYQPNISSLFTPLSGSGEIRGFFYDDKKYHRILSLLEVLSAGDLIDRSTLIQKIELQSMIWELIFGLEYKKSLKGILPPITPERSGVLLRLAHLVLKKTLLSDEEIRKIPNSLLSLSTQSGEAEIISIVERLVGHSDDVLEDLHPTQVHAEATAGRFYARIFFMLNEPEEFELLKKFMIESNDIHLSGFSWFKSNSINPGLKKAELLRALPSKFSNLRAILILSFNVLNEKYEVISTPLVAAWREYWINGKVFDAMGFEAVAKGIKFRLVEYKKEFQDENTKGLNDREMPTYYLRSNHDAAAFSLLDVNPVIPGRKITSVRGNCLGCHTAVINTFSAHVKEKAFAPPFVTRSTEIRGTFFKDKVEPRLKEWARSFLDGHEGSGNSSSTKKTQMQSNKSYYK